MGVIHALPGMGADYRMFPEPWAKLPGFVACDWMPHQGESTLTEVAASMVDRYCIRDGDILIGASLGGMVACEISKIRKIRQLFLVGSATRNDEVSRLLAVLHPLAKYAPIDWLRISAGSVPHDLVQMFAGIEGSFIRAMCAAVFKWEGLGETRARVFRIHGSRDLVIPPPAKVDCAIDGGHLISITHPADCVEFVGKVLQV